jgi:hypothetical protein
MSFWKKFLPWINHWYRSWSPLDYLLAGAGIPVQMPRLTEIVANTAPLKPERFRLAVDQPCFTGKRFCPEKLFLDLANELFCGANKLVDFCLDAAGFLKVAHVVVSTLRFVNRHRAR